MGSRLTYSGREIRDALETVTSAMVACQQAAHALNRLLPMGAGENACEHPLAELRTRETYGNSIAWCGICGKKLVGDDI